MMASRGLLTIKHPLHEVKHPGLVGTITYILKMAKFFQRTQPVSHNSTWQCRLTVHFSKYGQQLLLQPNIFPTIRKRRVYFVENHR